MADTFLTADEIYAIDKMTENELPNYLLSLPPDKQKLISHIYSKNRAIKAWKIIANENEEGTVLLRRLIENNKTITL